MQNNRLLLVVNPQSGKAKMRTELLSVVQILSNGGYEVTVYPTKKRGDATVYVEQLPVDKYGLIVVCGGDGTLNEVITGLMKAGNKCKIGYIPSGTLNEWSSGLNISRSITEAAKDILTGTETLLDIGMFGDRYFSYTASFGAFTSASYTAPQEVKNVLGQAAYFFEGIKAIGNIKPIHLNIKADDREIDGDFLFGGISNSMSLGGVVKFKDNLVKLNDGKFEIMLIRNPSNIIQFQGILDGILRQDLNREGIEFFRSENLSVTHDSTVDWTLDGEHAKGRGTVEIKNIHLALNLIVPQNSKVIEDNNKNITE